MGKEKEGKQSVKCTPDALPPGSEAGVAMESRDFMALAALAGAMFLWSGTFIAMKVVLSVFEPVFMLFVRMLGSALLLFPFMRHWSRKTPYAMGDWRIILLLVVSEPCLYFLFEGYALRYTTASQAGLITALLPLLVGVGAFFTLKERLPGKAWTGFCLAVGGVGLLTASGKNSEAAPNALLGNSLEFCAMLMACVYTLCVRRLVGYPPFFICAIQSCGGVLFFGIVLLLTGAPLPDELPPLAPILSLAFLSFSTVVAYGLYNIGIARLSAGQAAAWTNLIPVLTLFFGMIFLGERLTSLQAVAVFPILGGVLLSQLGNMTKK